MGPAFVLGNGISRQQIDLNLLKTLGRVYGCNAIYREFEPDVLISTDLPISERIQHEGYSRTHVHYTRKPLPDASYPQATVDSVDNICKSLILLEFSRRLQTAYIFHLIQCPLC